MPLLILNPLHLVVQLPEQPEAEKYAEMQDLLPTNSNAKTQLTEQAPYQKYNEKKVSY